MLKLAFKRAGIAVVIKASVYNSIRYRLYELFNVFFYCCFFLKGFVWLASTCGVLSLNSDSQLKAVEILRNVTKRTTFFPILPNDGSVQISLLLC